MLVQGSSSFMAAEGCRNSLSKTVLILASAAFSASLAVSFYTWRRKCRGMETRVRELENSLNSALEKCASERQGRVRAQQALRKELAKSKPDNLEKSSYPMRPIGVVRSCFSTRNGTPRQPLLISLARANLIVDPSLVPPASLEGLQEYSHCWIIYVFHLNTDLEKLWRKPSQSKFKAKVRVPRLNGGRMGVFATRSPHRPCPIGLTVAKVEAVKHNMVLLSGVDLVDGTPVLDVKPYLPYCECVQGAIVPNWVKDDGLLAVSSVRFSEDFSSSLSYCWDKVEKQSLYKSQDEFKTLIEQVLSWDIRSVSQRNQPHNNLTQAQNTDRFISEHTSNLDGQGAEDEGCSEQKGLTHLSADVIYHLILEGVDVSYRIASNSNVVVGKVTLPLSQTGRRGA